MFSVLFAFKRESRHCTAAAKNLFVQKFSSHYLLTFLPQTCLFPTKDIWISSLFYFVHPEENVASPSHVKHLSWLIEAERLMKTSTRSYQAALYHPSNPLLSAHTSQPSDQVSGSLWPPSLFLLRHYAFCVSQHRRQRGGELRHRERLRRLGEQRRGQLCGQVRCPLHWQSVHRERRNPGAHQEPAQHDPRYSARPVHSHRAAVLIPLAPHRVTLGRVYSQPRPTATEASKLINFWHIKALKSVDTRSGYKDVWTYMCFCVQVLCEHLCLDIW